MSARTALGASLNVPAVRVGAMLGPDSLFARLNAFGLSLSESAGYHGQALALGSADVTLLALTNAYRTLANGGMASAPLLRGAPASPASARRVADVAAVHLVADILADNSARARTFGLASALATRGFAAVKTGTSKDLRDNWCVGFTDRYTVGVWVGNASGEPMHDVSGVSGAAPVWHTLVARLHEGRPSRSPVRPAGVVVSHVAFESHREAPRDEVFIAGTEQARQRDSSQLAPQRAFGITSPRDGSRYALDPTSRRRRSRSVSRANTAPGCSTAGAWGRVRLWPGRRGRAGTSSRCLARAAACCRRCASRCAARWSRPPRPRVDQAAEGRENSRSIATSITMPITL